MSSTDSQSGAGVRQQTEYVILVDGNDTPLGKEEKVRCHMPDGKLHRAFTALLFEAKSNNLILCRRAKEKMLWPGYWDGTFASHPRESESYTSSCQRRMPEELGVISAGFEYMHKFEYHIPYRDIGSENEICATLVGTIPDASDITQIKGEIDGVRTVSAKECGAEVEQDADAYCPWMLVALYLLDRSDAKVLGARAGMLDAWMSRRVKESMRGAISEHMPDNAWRLVE